MILECGRAAVAYIIDLRPSASAQRMHHAVAHKPQHTHLHAHVHVHMYIHTDSYPF